MNLKSFAVLFASGCVLGVGLTVPSANAVGRGSVGIQVECDDFTPVCMSMGFDEEYCRALAMRLCSAGDGGDDNQP